MTDEPRRFPVETFERLPPHPLATHHMPTAPQEHVDRAAARLRDLIERMGYAEALWVAEELAFEFGVRWEPTTGRLAIELTDLQLIAFAAAMRSHTAATFPKKQTKDRLRKNRRIDDDLEDA